MLRKTILSILALAALLGAASTAGHFAFSQEREMFWLRKAYQETKSRLDAVHEGEASPLPIRLPSCAEDKEQCQAYFRAIDSLPAYKRYQFAYAAMVGLGMTAFTLFAFCILPISYWWEEHRKWRRNRRYDAIMARQPMLWPARY